MGGEEMGGEWESRVSALVYAPLFLVRYALMKSDNCVSPAPSSQWVQRRPLPADRSDAAAPPEGPDGDS